MKHIVSSKLSAVVEALAQMLMMVWFGLVIDFKKIISQTSHFEAVLGSFYNCFSSKICLTCFLTDIVHFMSNMLTLNWFFCYMVSFGTSCGSSFVPGHGCGGENEIQFVTKLKHVLDLNKTPCGVLPSPRHIELLDLTDGEAKMLCSDPRTFATKAASTQDKKDLILD